MRVETWNFCFAAITEKKIRNFTFEKQSSIWNQDKGTIMAGLLSKNKELLRLIPDLQCHDCKSVPGPNENQKNRYSCFDASHILCEEHKAKCPCGSKVKIFLKPLMFCFTLVLLFFLLTGSKLEGQGKSHHLIHPIYIYKIL